MCPEERALRFVRSHTSIPVPKVRRYVTNDTSGYLLLEKIEGKRLDKVWPTLSPMQRFLVAWTLRSYIKELRLASASYPRRHVPGPMASTPQQCYGPAWLFGDKPKGPFKSSKALIDHFNRIYEKLNGESFEDTQTLVLTHNDLNKRNIIVGRDGKLWLVDWEWSGFYPPWFEYIAMMSAADSDQAERSWWKHIPLVTGPYVKEKIMLRYKYFLLCINTT
jgi:thiamine kinase-like enzyme